MIEFELDIPSLTQDGSPLNGLFATVNELSGIWLIGWPIDHPFEYVVEKDKTDRIQLPHPPVLKISRFCELDLINSTIEVLVIQREVGGKHTIFSLGNMPVLVSLSMKFAAFMNCRTIEFYSKNEWMMNEICFDFGLSLLHMRLFKVISILLRRIHWGYWVRMIMMIELYLPSLTLLIGNGYNFYGIGRISLQSDVWWLNVN